MVEWGYMKEITQETLNKLYTATPEDLAMANFYGVSKRQYIKAIAQYVSDVTWGSELWSEKLWNDAKSIQKSIG